MSVFTELYAGLALRILYNNSIDNSHWGKLYPSFMAEIDVGFSWKYLRCTFGVSYDTNLAFQFNGSIGCAIPMSVIKSAFKGKKKAAK